MCIPACEPAERHIRGVGTLERVYWNGDTIERVYWNGGTRAGVLERGH